MADYLTERTRSIESRIMWRRLAVMASIAGGWFAFLLGNAARSQREPRLIALCVGVCLLALVTAVVLTYKLNRMDGYDEWRDSRR